jgi:hypothetical protein
MTRSRRFLSILVLATLMALAFLGGMLTAGGGLASPSGAAGQANLAPAQWAAVQAGNSLLGTGFSAVIYLPMISSE